MTTDELCEAMFAAVTAAERERGAKGIYTLSWQQAKDIMPSWAASFRAAAGAAFELFGVTPEDPAPETEPELFDASEDPDAEEHKITPDGG